MPLAANAATSDYDVNAVRHESMYATYEIWQHRDDAIQPLRAPWREDEQ